MFSLPSTLPSLPVNVQRKRRDKKLVSRARSRLERVCIRGLGASQSVSQSRQLRCCPSSCFMKLCFCFPVLSFHFLALESCFVFYFHLLFVYFCRLFHPLFRSLWLLSSIPSFFRSFPSFFPLLSVTHSSRCFSVWTSLFLHFYRAVLFSFFRPFFSVASSFSLSLFPGFFFPFFALFRSLPPSLTTQSTW